MTMEYDDDDDMEFENEVSYESMMREEFGGGGCCSDSNIISTDSGDNVCSSCGDVTSGDIWGTEEQQKQYGDSVCRSEYISDEQAKLNASLAKKISKNNLDGYIRLIQQKMNLSHAVSEDAIEIYREYVSKCRRIQSNESVAIMSVVIACYERKEICEISDMSYLTPGLLKLCRISSTYSKYFDLLSIPGHDTYIQEMLPRRVLDFYARLTKNGSFWRVGKHVQKISVLTSTRKRLHKNKI